MAIKSTSKVALLNQSNPGRFGLAGGFDAIHLGFQARYIPDPRSMLFHPGPIEGISNFIQSPLSIL